MRSIEHTAINPQICVMKTGTTTMRKITALLVGISLVVAAFAGLALAFVLGVIAAISMLIARLIMRLGLTATAKKSGKSGAGEFRVRNDGHGTIIDM